MRGKKIWWSFMMSHKTEIVKVLLLGLLSSYVTLLLTLSIGKYLEIAFAAGSGKTRALELLGAYLPSNLDTFFIFFTVVLVIKLLSSWMYHYRLAILGESFRKNLLEKIFNHHLRVKESGLLPASIILTYSSGGRSVQQLLVKGVIGFIRDLIFLLMGIYVLFFLHSTVTVVVILAILVSWSLYRWYNSQQKSAFVNKRKQQGSLLSVVSKSLMHENGNIENPSKKFNHKMNKLQQSLTTHHFQKTFLKVLTPFMLYVMLGLIMFLFASGIKRIHLEAGDVIAYLLLLMTLFPAVRNIIRAEQVWLEGKISAEKFQQVDSSNTSLTANVVKSV
jgi:ABC-type bacteriocin/lantibiotic exporter with double-glycine peptidase domain